MSSGTALIDLSQMILYAAIPAFTVAGIVVAVVDVGTVPESTPGIDHIDLVVGGALSATLVPSMLFVFYVLRLVTVAKRTLAIEPLILRESQRYAVVPPPLPRSACRAHIVHVLRPKRHVGSTEEERPHREGLLRDRCEP